MMNDESTQLQSVKWLSLNMAVQIHPSFQTLAVSHSEVCQLSGQTDKKLRDFHDLNRQIKRSIRDMK